jgi:hypothetical protein
MPSRIDSRTYGTVSIDRQKEMSGLEFVQGLANGTLPLKANEKSGIQFTIADQAQPEQIQIHFWHSRHHRA